MNLANRCNRLRALYGLLQLKPKSNNEGIKSQRLFYPTFTHGAPCANAQLKKLFESMKKSDEVGRKQWTANLWHSVQHGRYGLLWKSVLPERLLKRVKLIRGSLYAEGRAEYFPRSTGHSTSAIGARFGSTPASVLIEMSTANSRKLVIRWW